ncbi:hypothetical protein [Acetivibrio cellulolyticus]|uniref:hypothetical protein n=1 Tax=Acetivibrio cellulolyticus TaxID=35830 RepID=UPI0001E2E769|nr:hypothetical protein [Acetivibrio cellulolyticus]
MSRKGIGFGVFLIAIGILAFLIQFGILSGSVLMVFINHAELTVSLILIVVGINMIFKKYSFVKVLTWLAFFVVMIVYGNYAEVDVEKSSNDTSKTFAVEQYKETGNGELNLSASAINLNVGSTDANLIDGMVKNVGIDHKENYKNDNETAIIKFETNSKDVFENFFKNLFTAGKFSIDRKCNLNLNSSVVWDVKMDLDAIDSDIDLSDLKVKNLDIDGDAGSFKLTFGREYKSTKAKIDADAAKVEVFVPVDSGIRVKIDGDASSTDFNDISLERKGEYYISKNYEEMDEKIELDVQIDAGSLKISGI